MVTCQQLGHTPSQTQPFDISKTRGSLAVFRGDLNPSIVCRAGRNKAIRLESRRDSCEGGQNKRVKISFCRIGETNGFPKRTTAQGGSETKTRKTEGEYLGGVVWREGDRQNKVLEAEGGARGEIKRGGGGRDQVGRAQVRVLVWVSLFLFPCPRCFSGSFVLCVHRQYTRSFE